MKIYRGGRTGRRWSLTDSQKPYDYIKYWNPEVQIKFDGTINKEGDRHTDFGLQIEEADVIALFNAMVRRHRETQSQLRRDLEAAKADTARLELALEKISRLIMIHSDDAPSHNALVDAVRTIAEHYRWPWNKGRPRIAWIKWNSV